MARRFVVRRPGRLLASGGGGGGSTDEPASGAADIAACTPTAGPIDISGSYTVTGNIKFTGTAFNVTGNCTLNLNGKTIYYGTGNGNDVNGVLIDNYSCHTLTINGPGYIVHGGTGLRCSTHYTWHAASDFHLTVQNGAYFEAGREDGACIYQQYFGMTLRDSTFRCRMDATANRHLRPANIWASSASVDARDCIFIGGNTCIYSIHNDYTYGGTTIVQRCFLAPDQFATNGYALAQGQFDDCVCLPIEDGRGVGMGPTEDAWLRNSVVVALDRPGLIDYTGHVEFGDPAALDGPGFRMRHWDESIEFTSSYALRVVVENNSIFTVGGGPYCNATALFLTNRYVDGSVLTGVSASASGSLITLTKTSHGLSTGNKILCTGFSGGIASSLNQKHFTITVVDANSFTLNGSSANGSATGGTVGRKQSAFVGNTLAAFNLGGENGSVTRARGIGLEWQGGLINGAVRQNHDVIDNNKVLSNQYLISTSGTDNEGGVRQTRPIKGNTWGWVDGNAFLTLMRDTVDAKLTSLGIQANPWVSWVRNKQLGASGNLTSKLTGLGLDAGKYTWHNGQWSAVTNGGSGTPPHEEVYIDGITQAAESVASVGWEAADCKPGTHNSVRRLDIVNGGSHFELVNSAGAVTVFNKNNL